MTIKEIAKLFPIGSKVKASHGFARFRTKRGKNWTDVRWEKTDIDIIGYVVGSRRVFGGAIVYEGWEDGTHWEGKGKATNVLVLRRSHAGRDILVDPDTAEVE